jgi:hypothetical protein
VEYLRNSSQIFPRERASYQTDQKNTLGNIDAFRQKLQEDCSIYKKAYPGSSRQSDQPASSQSEGAQKSANTLPLKGLKHYLNLTRGAEGIPPLVSKGPLKILKVIQGLGDNIDSENQGRDTAIDVSAGEVIGRLVSRVARGPWGATAMAVSEMVAEPMLKILPSMQLIKDDLRSKDPAVRVTAEQHLQAKMTLEILSLPTKSARAIANGTKKLLNSAEFSIPKTPLMADLATNYQDISPSSSQVESIRSKIGPLTKDP